MTHDAPHTSDAVQDRPVGGFGRPGPAAPTIDRWSVTGHDRIIGVLREAGHPSHGKKIITSPVIRMRVAETGEHVAHTQSGNRYVLSSPAAGFGTQQAMDFVRFKCGVPSSQAVVPVEPAMQTGLLKLQA